MKVLVANRGEIACRILRTLREMDLPAVAVVAEADRGAMHAELAGEAVTVGGYLDIEGVVGAARRTGATAVHPGYGFLSQSAAFARSCRDAGLVFIGPSPEAMEALGDKRGSRRTAEALGIPVVPGARECDSEAAVRETAARLGYPVLLKAAGGGGGRGMRLVRGEGDLAGEFASARREAKTFFADDRLVVEKYVHPARHVEVQVLGDGREVVCLGERECSLQRRYQKVIEEAPSPGLPAAVRPALWDAAVRLARAAGYRSAGTVEFLVEPSGQFHFLEVNTRIQVEHPVTETVMGLDLVRCQVELELGRGLPAPTAARGHAIEARLNAEDPYRQFLPQTGGVQGLHWPNHPGVRIDAGIREGSEVTPHFDPLLAKVIAWGTDREQARRRLVEALREAVLLGVVTNQAFLLQVLESRDFVRGETFTTTLESASWEEPAVPEEVAAFAMRCLESREGGTPGGEDRFSPWRGR